MNFAPLVGAGFKPALIAILMLAAGVVESFAAGITAGITIGPGASITCSGSPTITTVNLTINGELNAGAGTVNLSGTWTRNGTFNPGTSTVGIVGPGTAIITGTNTFYNFSCTTAGKEIHFAADERQTITNALTFTGTAASRILLRSSTSGTRWDIDPQRTRSVSFVDCQDSYNINSTVITAAHSKDSGNNVNWDFMVQLVFITPAKTLTAGTVSDTYTVQLRDGTGSPTNAGSAINVHLSTTSTGTYEFRASPTGISISSVTISIGSSEVSFYYIDYQVGSPTITVSGAGLTSASQRQTVNAAAFAGSTHWWDVTWRYRRKITFDNSGQTSNLINFPALVRLTNTDFTYANAQSAGQDIRFVDADQISQLPYEIEGYNDVSGNSFIWVRVPQIDASSNMDYIWMYYGKPTAQDAQNANAVWDANYVASWRLREAGTGAVGEYRDSTVNANHGQGGGGTAAAVPTQVEGKIAKAQRFDGMDDHVSIGNCASLRISGAVTLEAWVNPIDFDFPEKGVIIRNGLGFDLQYSMFVANNRNLCFYWYDGTWRFIETSGGLIPPNVWTHIIAVRRPDNTIELYINGELRGIGTGTQETGGGGSVNIGSARPGNAVQDFNGPIDEVRISNIARSADWIRASYLNQSGAAFLSLGSEQTPKLVFTTAAQTFSAGSQSSIMTVQVQDPDNRAIDVSSDITVNLTTTSSTGRFSTDGLAWSLGNTHSITISAGANSTSFYYKDILAGTATLIAAESPALNWTDTSQTVTVVVGSFSVTASTPTPIAGGAWTLTVTALDAYGNTDTNYSGTVNLTVRYNSPSSGTGTLSVSSLTSFSDGVALTASQTFSDCGIINIVATDAAEPTKTGISSNINFRPYDFTVVASNLDTNAPGGAYGRHTVAKPWTLTITARNAQGATCPNYQGTANLTINYVSPLASQAGSLSTNSLTPAYWSNGIATLTNQTYNKWGTITITAADAVLTTQTGTSSNIIFIPKDFSISLSSPPALRTFYYVNEEFIATVTARDYNNSAITNYQGTIRFDASGLGGAITNYTYTIADAGTHTFSGLSGTSEKTTSISVKDTTYTGITGLSSTIAIKSATIKVISNSGPVGPVSVQIKILDSKGNVITEDNSSTFTVTITEVMKNNSAVSTATTTAVKVSGGIATITIRNTERETITITPSATPALTTISGTVRFGTVGSRGIGIQLWREIKDPTEDEEEER